MKFVNKGEPPHVFEQWKAQENADWKPSYADLRHPEKTAVHESLLVEQGWVCCYCGRSVTAQDSHIEHYRPQESHAALALAYGNLHASCGRDQTPGSPLHCGHAKANDFDEERQLSPLEAGCESRYTYTLDGQICASDLGDAKANFMRVLLKLDIPFLRNRRQEVVQRVFDVEFLDSATVEELRMLCTLYRRHGEDGKALNLGHVLARVAEQRLADMNTPDQDGSSPTTTLST